MPVVEFYPESFNQLRKKLFTEHEDLWAKVGWLMANDQLEFLKQMNEELGVLCLPEQGIQEVCEKYLAALMLRNGKAARKSFELIAAERTGRMGTAAIFGTTEDDAQREEIAEWKRRNPGKTAPIH